MSGANSASSTNTTATIRFGVGREVERGAHAGRPKSPSGRTASTTASSTNVKMIE